MGLALVALLRLGAPLLILRFPLAGGIVAILADMFDMAVLERFGWRGLSVEHYQLADKLFDTYYLALELMVAFRWRNRLLRDAAAGLFIWRAAGVAAFALSGREEVLFLAPNIFEYFYLFVLLATRFRPSFRINRPVALALLLFALAAPKFLNEYVLHVRKTSTANFLREEIAPVFVPQPVAQASES